MTAYQALITLEPDFRITRLRTIHRSRKSFFRLSVPMSPSAFEVAICLVNCASKARSRESCASTLILI